MDSTSSHGVGLCADCRHASRTVSLRGSVFWRCLLANRDSRFEKYPRLPVMSCPGFEPTPTTDDPSRGHA